jgi:glycosyltransferase involved in cell wall biosynthesis
MKILWFTNTPSLYDQEKHYYNGCGWIESLEEIIRKRSEIQLAVAFFHPKDSVKTIKNGVTYYPILQLSKKKNPIRSIYKNWFGKIEQEEYQKIYLKIIDDFQPDTIQVFGTEGPFAKVLEFTKKPVLVHLQGLINPYANTYYPIGCSKYDFLFSKIFLFKNLIGSSPIFGYKRFIAQAKREKQIFQKLKYVCGRTEWDYQIARLYNPNIKYFHVEEVLRSFFYEKSSLVKTNSRKKFLILSTLSPTIYKGIDVVFKTAQKLIDLTELDFEWRLIGIDDKTDLVKFFEKKTGIKYSSAHIKLLGKMNPEEIIKQMLEADLFVHPSYIDNSPNSVCEAQMMGLPVIACNVGGLSSLITHNDTGILIPSNGVYELVRYISLLEGDPSLRMFLGERGKEKAMLRHNREQIVDSLLKVYSEII